MSWTRGKIWKWVVIAATVSAFAGALADAVTDTLLYWPLLVPAYVTIAVSTWRGLGGKAEPAKPAMAALDAEEAAGDGRPALPPQPAIVDAGPAASAAGDFIVEQVRQVSLGSVTLGLFSFFLRGLWTAVVTFIGMIVIQAAVSIATWGRGYWYIYGPAFAGIGWLIWTMVRSGPADVSKAAAKSAGERIVR